MKKRLQSLCLMAVVTVIGMSAWALQKNTEGAYQIGSAEDLKAFAELVNGGETHAWGQLTADIDYGTEQTMIGCNDYNYCGLFDGQGHTIKFSFYPDADGSALFRNVGTTGQIKNLHVVGNITTSKKYAAGLVVWNSGAISNCVSELTVNSGVAGDATHGGIILAPLLEGKVVVAGSLLAGILVGSRTELHIFGGIKGYEVASLASEGCACIGDLEISFVVHRDAVLYVGASISPTTGVCIGGNRLQGPCRGARRSRSPCGDLQQYTFGSDSSRPHVGQRRVYHLRIL